MRLLLLLGWRRRVIREFWDQLHHPRLKLLFLVLEVVRELRLHSKPQRLQAEVRVVPVSIHVLHSGSFERGVVWSPWIR